MSAGLTIVEAADSGADEVKASISFSLSSNVENLTLTGTAAIDGTGNALDFTRYTSINPDLSLRVLREPRGEWIGIVARSRIEADGIGQSHGTLFDDEGPVARALASLLVERR